MHVRTSWLLACGLLAAGLARAELIELKFDERGRFEHEATVAPGKFVEVCGALPAGALVQWTFQAQAPGDFNIHFHEGTQVRFPAKLAGAASGEGLLKAESAQDYCWMWTHKGKKQPARLQLRLSRAD